MRNRLLLIASSFLFLTACYSDNTSRVSVCDDANLYEFPFHIVGSYVNSESKTVQIVGKYGEGLYLGKDTSGKDIDLHFCKIDQNIFLALRFEKLPRSVGAEEAWGLLQLKSLDEKNFETRSVAFDLNYLNTQGIEYKEYPDGIWTDIEITDESISSDDVYQAIDWNATNSNQVTVWEKR